MGVTKAASIASVVEYGWSGRLVVPWQENREKVLKYNRIVLPRLKRRVKLPPRRQVCAQTLRATQT